MRKILLILSVVVFSIGAFAQNCETYIPTTVGTKVTTEHYDKKDKLTSTETTEIKSVEMVDGKQKVVVEVESIDADGISSGKSELTYYCNGNVFEVDTKSMLDQNQMGAYESMQIEYTFENLQYPANMTEGMTLEDGYVEAVVSNEGMKIMTLRVDIKDSKVEAIESITVPAGTYDAAKINQTIISKTGFITIQMQSIQWMVKGIGAVRTETYNKKGKLVGYSIVKSVE
ncbi:MAG: hypothetical protein C0596_09355 [Marinilabiliales bacterium]|nr:MAG: hypothetical protein C0596_09355 [Marinilabiliales bacterium]